MNAQKKKDKKKHHRPAGAAGGMDAGAKDKRQEAQAQGAHGQGASSATFGSVKPKAGFKEGSLKASGFAFGKENYRLLLIGLAFLVAGFLLMIGGGAEDRTEFSYDIFNFRRLTLAPILILIGYVIEIFAIMKKPKD